MRGNKRGSVLEVKELKPCTTDTEAKGGHACTIRLNDGGINCYKDQKIQIGTKALTEQKEENRGVRGERL